MLALKIGSAFFAIRCCGQETAADGSCRPDAGRALREGGEAFAAARLELVLFGGAAHEEEKKKKRSIKKDDIAVAVALMLLHGATRRQSSPLFLHPDGHDSSSFLFP